MRKSTYEENLGQRNYYENILKRRVCGETLQQIGAVYYKDAKGISDNCMKALLLMQIGDIDVHEKICEQQRKDKFGKFYQYIFIAKELEKEKNPTLLQQQKENAASLYLPGEKRYFEKLLKQRAEGDKFAKLEHDFGKSSMAIGRDCTEALLMASVGLITMPNTKWNGSECEFSYYYDVIQRKYGMEMAA